MRQQNLEGHDKSWFFKRKLHSAISSTPERIRARILTDPELSHLTHGLDAMHPASSNPPKIPALTYLPNGR